MKTDMHCYVLGERRKVPDTFDGYFDPTKTAIVEIDMHRGHLDDSPDCTCPLPSGRAKIQAHNEFNEAARKLGVKVIHVRLIYRADGIDHIGGPKGPWPVITPIYQFVFGAMMDNMKRHNLEGSKWTEFVVDVEEGDYIVNYKKRYSGFYQTDLEFLLTRLGVEAVVITGVMTDACDLCTAFDAVNRDYKVLVPQDVAAGTPECEQAALNIMSMHLGLVVNWRELVAEWKARLEDS